MKKYLPLVLSIIAIVISVMAVAKATTPTVALGSNANRGTRACTSFTSTKVAVGNQATTQVLATSSARAWAKITMPAAATSSLSVAFNGDAAAVSGNGVQLNGTASSTDGIAFGLDTDLPYVGSVQAITNVGSTTVLVTECNY